jgi:hypothetical protein
VWLYLAVAAVAVGLQALIYSIWPTDAMLAGSGIVVNSLAATIIYAFTLGDVDGFSPSLTWLRVLERAWAVVVVSLIQTFVIAIGLAALRFGDIVDRIYAIPLLLGGVCLNFSDVDAVVTEDDRVLLLVPQALLRSFRATWTGTTMLRAIALVFTQVLVDRVCEPLHPLAQVSIDTLVFVPIAVLTVYVYLDAIGHEPARSCSE